MTFFYHHFFLKKPKAYQDGPIPIYLRIMVSGDRAEISVRKKVDPTKWCAEAGRIKGTTQLVRKWNAYLVSMESKLFDAFQLLLQEKDEVTAASLKNKFTGVGDKHRMLVTIFQQHNDELASLVPRQFSKGTLERYKTSISHTIKFIKWKYNISDIDVRLINHEFIAGYDFYLRSLCSCSNNTTVKYLKNFKKIIRICIANGWIDKDPFVHYRSRVKVIPTIFLSEEELEKVLQKDFGNRRLNQVRDIFAFCCFTGLAYSDVKKMTAKDISLGGDDNKCLQIKRTKTNISSIIPLLPPALKILAKYENHSDCLSQNKLLPVLSNQKTNDYLKEIANICGIHKKVTFHTARHTFATTVTLNNDVPIESVSRMLGHRSILATEHYAKISDKKISRDMHLLYEKFGWMY